MKPHRFIIHENFNRTTLFGDIGLIELDVPMNFTETIAKISQSKEFIDADAVAVTCGWGMSNVKRCDLFFHM